MICNCNNNNQGTSDVSQMVARLVYGNVLRLAIPLTLRTITLVDGKVETEDTDFIPNSDYPVIVQLDKRSATTIKLEATICDGNIAVVEDKGNIPIGTYAVTVLAKDDKGDPYRFKKKAGLIVVDATKDAGIEAGVEYEVTTQYLDAAIFFALRGEGGAEQVQADWEETDTTDPAYILNKPDVYTKAEVDALVGGGGDSGYNVAYDNGNVIFSGSKQPTYDNGNIIF